MRQLRMIWLRYTGKTYRDIGYVFGITPSGARATIHDGLRAIRSRHVSAFPDEVKELPQMVSVIEALIDFAKRELISAQCIEEK